nr:Protein involved in mRNA turnover and stability [Ipomoea batatas]GMD26653.1 Protein involved in mRNA turnover and stability [Ipomoea batatas]
MGDHFVFLVDRLLTESTLEAAIESRNQKQLTVEDMAIDCSSNKDSEAAATSLKKIVECRICQDEDFDSNMETPCYCCGSLKYAHRKCVQRWCNEKGDTLCEICNQPFTPGYTAPPPIFRLGGIPMNFRGNWGIARRDLNYAHLTAVVSADRNFVDSSHDDYAVSTSSSNVMCFRSIALIFMVLLILRHTLPIISVQAGDYPFPLIMLLLLRIAGVVFPIYIIFKAVTSFLHRRQQQANQYTPPSDEEAAG